LLQEGELGRLDMKVRLTAVHLRLKKIFLGVSCPFQAGLRRFNKRSCVAAPLCCIFLIASRLEGANGGKTGRSTGWRPKCTILGKKVFSLPPPKEVLEGPKGEPRMLLFIGVKSVSTQEGEYKVTATDYYIFDPQKPERGLHKTSLLPPFRVQEVITPFARNWCLVEEVRDDQPKYVHEELSRWSSLASREGILLPVRWFNPYSGEYSEALWIDSITLIDFGSLRLRHAQGGYSLQKYDVREGQLVRYKFSGFWFHEWLNDTRVLGVKFTQKKKFRILDVDLDTGKLHEWASELPEQIWPKQDWGEIGKVAPAGKLCRDGVFVVTDFDVWWKPPGREWRMVVGRMAVPGFTAMLFGPAVTYVGTGRFAITTNTSLNSDNHDLLSVTSLVDGWTGKILEKADPVPARHLKPNIPPSWWDPELRPPLFPQVSWKEYFGWDQENRVLFYGESGIARIPPYWSIQFSEDGTCVVMYGPKTDKKGRRRLKVRVVLGETGRMLSFDVTPEKPKGEFGYVSWIRAYPGLPAE